MLELGIVCGRFQPLHMGHMDYIGNALRESKQLIIGITNPDPQFIKSEETCEHRSLLEANPFTYYERYRMIKNSLLSTYENIARIDIVPFPINNPELLKNYIPLDGCFFVDIFDNWGYRKVELLKSAGIENIRIRIVEKTDESISGTKVRHYIKSYEDISQIVPREVVKVMNDIGFSEIRRRMDAVS